MRALQPHAPGSTLGEVLKGLRIPPKMLGYSAVDDDFTLEFKSLDQISHDEPEETPQEAEAEDN